jgi:hypothetical protein
VNSFVVHLVGTDNPHPFKHFAQRVDAAAYAASLVQSGEADRADIYSVSDADARAAVDAVKTGAAELIDSKSRRMSDAEALALQEQAFEDARKQGPRALLKFLGLIADKRSPP